MVRCMVCDSCCCAALYVLQELMWSFWIALLCFALLLEISTCVVGRRIRKDLTRAWPLALWVLFHIAYGRKAAMA
jgi:hypothetical protein